MTCLYCGAPLLINEEDGIVTCTNFGVGMDDPGCGRWFTLEDYERFSEAAGSK